jgi:hypothetical protein
MVLRFSLPLLGRMSFFRLDRRRRAGKSRVVLPGVGRGGEWNPLNPEPARLAVAFYDSPGLLYDRGVAYDLPGGPPFTHMAKPKLNLDRLNPDEVVSLASTIKTALTGNATFTTPNPTLVALGTLITTAQTKTAAYNTARAALQTLLDDRDAAVEALRAGLRAEAAYVENVSGGDPVKIQSAGMAVRAGNAPVGSLGQVSNLAVAAGDDDGELDATWDPVRGAKSYQVQTCADPITPAGWKDAAPVSKSRKALTNLPSGVRTWVRVRAIGAKEENNGAWSDPAVKTVP